MTGTPPTLRYPTFARAYTEFIGVRTNGHLWVEDCDTVDLAARFGTPLYVISENQLRHEYRRFRNAFASRYPSVEVHFANKSHNALAIRHILNQEGAGGECFGATELYLSLLSGLSTDKIVLNGSNKAAEELTMAVGAGVWINIDALDEVDMIEAAVAETGRVANVGVRLKLDIIALRGRQVGSTNLADRGLANKWGLPLDQAVAVVRRVRDNPSFALKGLSYHLGRHTHEASDFMEMARETIRCAVAIHAVTGWMTPSIDLGGGWAYGRLEKTGPLGEDDATTPTFEQYAEAVCDALKGECRSRGMPLPALKLEPGRALSSSIGITLGRVGVVKKWPGFKNWINVDTSSNHVSRIELKGWYHHIVCANRAAESCTERADIVGPLCSVDVLGSARDMPPVRRGDLLALLDTGSYAETTALNYNGQPRPATVLVCGSDAEVTTCRERLSDVIGRYRVPARLLGKSGATRPGQITKKPNRESFM